MKKTIIFTAAILALLCGCGDDNDSGECLKEEYTKPYLEYLHKKYSPEAKQLGSDLKLKITECSMLANCKCYVEASGSNMQTNTYSVNYSIINGQVGAIFDMLYFKPKDK